MYGRALAGHDRDEDVLGVIDKAQLAEAARREPPFSRKSPYRRRDRRVAQRDERRNFSPELLSRCGEAGRDHAHRETASIDLWTGHLEAFHASRDPALGRAGDPVLARAGGATRCRVAPPDHAGRICGRGDQTRWTGAVLTLRDDHFEAARGGR